VSQREHAREEIPMDRILPILVVPAIIVFIVAWHRALYRRTGGRSMGPLWGAFNATLGSVLFLISGAVGYKMSHGLPFTNRAAWTGTIVWPEIAVGLVLAVLAAVLWRFGLRSLRAESARRA
jgi:hypothetical protein